MRPSGALPAGAGRERASLVVRLDPVDGAAEEEAEREHHELVQRTFAQAGIRMSDRWWAEVSLDDPESLRPLVERLETLARDGVARPGAGHLSFRLDDHDEAPLEWFELDPARTFPMRRSQPYQEVSAGDLPPGCHVADGGTHFVSDAFKKAVEEGGLTGLEVLWVRDVGRFKAPQWYEAMPAVAIGRGLDHPWFDRTAFEGWWRTGGDALPMLESLLATNRGPRREQVEAKREALLKRRAEAAAAGARQFDVRFFRSGAGFADPERSRLIRLFASQHPLNSLKVVSPLIVLRRFLPASDFAFSWGDWEGGARDDDAVPFGRVCFNRRVHDVLRRRRLVRPQECRGVLVLDEPPPGVEVFDDPDHPPPRSRTPDELAGARVDEARFWKRHVSRPLKERAVTLEAALKRLKATRRRQADSFEKPASPRALDAAETELGRPLPTAWRAVLQIADGFEPDSDEPCRVVGTSELVSFHRETLEWVEHTEGHAESGLLYVGAWPAGDLLALEVPRGKRLETCAVLRIDHEELAEARRWPGVAEYLDELLASG